MIAAKRRILIILSIFTLGMAYSGSAYAIDARVKSLGVMAAYGTIGGALLGTASLAFGSSGRSVAKGASLGLYAGIIFGTYVVASHAYRRNKLANPEPEPYGGDSDYQDDSGEGQNRGLFDGFDWGGFGGSSDDEESGSDDGYYEGDGYARRWNPYYEMGELRYNAEEERVQKLRPTKYRPVYYLNLINYQF